MKRCRLLVEGATEETFVNRLLKPHLYSLGFHDVSVTVVLTKRAADGRKFTGGVSRWSRLRQDIQNLAADSGAVVTTMVDFYGLPNDVPGFSSLDPRLDPRSQVRVLEQAIAADIDMPNFLPHISLHEFEALLYTDPSAVSAHFGDPNLADRLDKDLTECGEPELVDNGPSTAPSKRLANHIPRYLKTSDGPAILADLGLPRIRQACPNFDTWLTEVEKRLA